MPFEQPTAPPDSHVGEKNEWICQDWNNSFRLGPGKSALANLPEDRQRFPRAIWFKRLLMEETYVLSLNADAMRLPSPA